MTDSTGGAAGTTDTTSAAGTGTTGTGTTGTGTTGTGTTTPPTTTPDRDATTQSRGEAGPLRGSASLRGALCYDLRAGERLARISTRASARGSSGATKCPGAASSRSGRLTFC